jgi:hypothetical protein
VALGAGVPTAAGARADRMPGIDAWAPDSSDEDGWDFAGWAADGWASVGCAAGGCEAGV